MSTLQNRKILLGVCGSIAAYKAVYLLRELQKKGAEVKVIMTPSAAKFVTPLTFSSLSRNPALSDTFDGQAGVSIEHVDLGLWAEAMLVAPATGSTIAKFAQGIADNLLTSTALAIRAPLFIAPAMDVDMYSHPATTRNISLLKERGVFVIDPQEGELASGLSGTGRLAEIETIVGVLEDFFAGHVGDFAGRRVLVTAGPTQEPIDAVRYISNRSSGKMGYALALAAANRGAEVRLISGPTSLQTPRNVTREDVSTAAEMYAAVHNSIDDIDILIMSAAVADYRLAHPSKDKLKREGRRGENLNLELVENVDILKSLSDKKGKKIFVGFALEGENGLENATAKLKSKPLDMIVLNGFREQGAGFGAETNKVTLIGLHGTMRELPLMPKYEVALKILDEINLLFKEKHPA